MIIKFTTTLAMMAEDKLELIEKLTGVVYERVDEWDNGPDYLRPDPNTVWTLPEEDTDE